MVTATHHRRVLRIRAEDSPNVRLAIDQMRRGLRRPHPVLLRSDMQPWGVFSQEEFAALEALWRRRGSPEPPAAHAVPGVLSFEEYVLRRQTWDAIRQCVGLDGLFYEGAEVMLFPAAWLDRAHHVAESLGAKPRRAESMGVDPGEGGANSSWVVGDRLGILDVVSAKTPNTTVVPNTTLAMARKWNIPAEKVAMDRGGGGKQHADHLRERHGFDIRTVAFGEAPSIELRRQQTMFEERFEVKEEKYAFLNRRAEMYWDARQLLDPAANPQGYGIPRAYTNLRSELEPIPMQLGGEGKQWSCWDQEGRFRLPPKNRKGTGQKTQESEITLTDIIGHSPDEADAWVLQVHAMLDKTPVAFAGVR